jgi:DNA-binding NarL/FixJ family response regulator
MLTSDVLRVLLVDDHNLFRKGLAALLSSHSGIEVVGEAENGKEAIELTRQLTPDLVLMDLQMPECDGATAVKAIKKEMPQVRIVILSAFDDDDNLFGAIKNGADGYLLKNINPSQLLAVLAEVKGGVAPISRVLADRILQEFRKPASPVEPRAAHREMLTPNERETLELLVKGLTNKDIADALHVSENTVKLHLRNIMEKLHLQNRTQLAVYALNQGLLDDPAGA